VIFSENGESVDVFFSNKSLSIKLLVTLAALSGAFYMVSNSSSPLEAAS
jgi:hypothetical protein